MYESHSPVLALGPLTFERRRWLEPDVITWSALGETGIYFALGLLTVCGGTGWSQTSSHTTDVH